MLFAPLGVSMAAFGRGRLATAVLGLGGLVVLLWWGAGPLFPAPPEPWRGRMTAACAAGAAALLWMGVGGLADAHRGAVRSLELAGQGLLEEAAAKMRSLEQVGARVAHEVKNPLASVKGLAALLAEGEADPRRQRRFEVLQGEVERIEKILGDYLSFSRPMEGLREGEFALDELARALVEVLDGRARRQDAVVVAAGGELSLRGDRARLFEALLNLTSNALEAGARRVELRWGIAGAGVRVQVRDDGRGMGPEELARLGTPFHTTREGGTGLGVVLARAAVRQHGGELTFESAPGQGTTVTLMFPGERAIHGDHRAG
jgi:signal transduction histidine kinase